MRHPDVMTSPRQTITVSFAGGPLAGRTAELDRRPAPIVRVESNPEGAYVLEAGGRGYGWHVPDPDPPADVDASTEAVVPEPDEAAPRAQHRPRTRRR